MNSELKSSLANYLIALGDDELLLGHRNSEWCGHAPILEEDIAFANLALDEIGHAVVWYSLAGGLADEDPDEYPDQLVYFREASQFRNLQMMELPRGDWAFSILRQFLFDALEKTRLERLARSAYPPLAEAAGKIAREEVYHYRHSLAWLVRLGQGTEESRTRMQRALDELWPYAAQAFTRLPAEEDLAAAGLVPPAADVQAGWESLVLPALRESGLVVPDSGAVSAARGEHTSHITGVLAEMQSLPRAEPGARW
jgi:ring-1,2-phenylacetyl-CoA epoxidase subunit PaaC